MLDTSHQVVTGHQAEEVERTVDTSAFSAIWSVGSPTTLIRDVQDQFRSWLHGKTPWDPPIDRSSFEVGPKGQELLAVHRSGSEGTSLSLRLTESNQQGAWRTNLVAHQASGGTSWLRLRVSSAERRTAKVPRLASFLLEALDLRDGQTWLSAKPRIASIQDVEQVAEEVTDPDRQGLYFVAGTDDSLPFQAFAEKVEEWTFDTRGMAQVAVLDPLATREFATIMGRSHEAPAWKIRTFNTSVDPAITADGRRHRILGTQRLVGPDAVVRVILGTAARTHAARRPLPSSLATVQRALTRAEDRLLIEALQPIKAAGSTEPRTVESPSSDQEWGPEQAAASELLHPGRPSVSDQASAYLAQVELVKETLGVDSIDRATLLTLRHSAEMGQANAEAIDRVTRQLEERRDRIASLEVDLELTRELSDDQELELAEALESLTRQSDEVRWLRQRLAEAGDWQHAYESMPPAEGTRYPSDFSTLADELDSLKKKGVFFSGEKSQVAKLADQDPVGRIAGVTWECLLALADYVDARATGQHTQGLRSYLENPPPGHRTVPPKKYASKESASTMQAWGHLREFPVPTSVSSSGRAVMEAHFKLGRVGMVSPRMYYLDNFTGDGCVYVGYIGSHPRNTQTN